MPPPNTPDESLPDEEQANLAVFLPPDQPRRPDSILERRTTRTTEHQTAPSQRGPAILPLDYQVLDYVDTVDDTLLCPVCRTAFHSPIITTCGHTFCATCINRALEMQPTCPIDRKPINKTSDFHQPPLIIKEQLDRLKVKCPNVGCGHICSREHLEGHYEHRCEYTQVLCPSSWCEKRIARRYVSADSHCMHSEAPCQYCEENVAEIDLSHHYDYLCNGVTATCQQCEASIVQHRLEKHIEEDCPETEVDCQWFSIGCKVSDKRLIVFEHEKDCPYKIIGQLVKERAEDRKLIDGLMGRITVLETRAYERHERQARRAQRGSLWPPPSTTAGSQGDSVPGAETEEERYLRSSTSPEGYMLARFERLESRMEDLAKQLQDMDAYQSSFVLQQLYPINNQLVELGSKVGVLNMHTTWLMNMQRFQQRAVQTNGPGLANPGMSSAAENNAPPPAVDDYSGPHYDQYYRTFRRRNSDGRDMPPRL